MTTEDHVLTVETVNVEDVAADIAEKAPVVVDEAVGSSETITGETPAQDEQSKETPLTGEIDDKGNVHDPDIHQSPPKKKKDGTWAKKKGRGSKKFKENQEIRQATGSYVHKPSGQAPPNGQPELSNKIQMRQDENKAASIACAEATFALGEIIGGPKFAPGAMEKTTGLNSKDERSKIQNGYYGYFESTGEAFKLPPWAGLAIALGSYSASRMHEPDVKKHAKGRFFKWFNPVGRWWSGLTKKRTQKKEVVKKEAKTTGKQKSEQPKTYLDRMGFEGAGGFA